jgi:arginine-tRNA-protein transferase
MNSRQLQLYITAEAPCSYFTDRLSRNLIPDPAVPMNMPIYNQLIQHGFRRSGRHCYRPHCKDCQACISCRIPVNDFITNRSQQRCLSRNKDLDLSVVSAGFSDEYFELYQRYLNSRHSDGTMANPVKEDFEQFLYCDWSDTRFLELRLNGQLVAIAVSDFISDGLSAVYSFFDPELEKRSLGTCCILKQIDYAKQLELEYVYLGYWIENHKKMHYKNNFRPLQLFINEQWQLRNIDA